MATTSTVDFFGYQEQARKKTSFLVFLYCVAVALIILAVYAAVAGILLGGNAHAGREVSVANFFDLDLFAIVAGATLLIVAGGSMFKSAQLAGGGASVATMLGGQLINPNTRDLDERKILNVVEEMAIASGIPVPRVYILNDENSINAFAAGFSTRDVVIGVTRGCVRVLTRDELQGVVAHEFSHILNGDMRLNIRLMGVLFGILVIAIIGRILLRTRGKKNPLPLLGLALIIIGYVGVFFGNLIKSAVSRQREYLADASAVQFTRNPSGISGALKKIAGYTGGSGLQTANAEQASHLFFANGLAGEWLNLFATHPPVEERIRRLDPSFAGEGVTALRAPAQATPSQFAAAARTTAGLAGFQIAPGEVVARIGAPKAEHLALATGIVAALPTGLTSAASDPFGASALIYGLLLNEDPAARSSQLSIIEKNTGPEIYRETLKLQPVIDRLPREHRLPLAELAVSALKGLSDSQYRVFCGTTVQMIEADDQVDLFEYALQRMIVRRLEPVFNKVPPTMILHNDIRTLLPHCNKLLSCLAYWGADDEPSAAQAFSAGAVKLGPAGTITMLPKEACGLEALDATLDVLPGASPAVKKMILNACISCVGADGRVTVEEAEVLRAVADTLDCPIPPFVPDRQAA